MNPGTQKMNKNPIPRLVKKSHNHPSSNKVNKKIANQKKKGSFNFITEFLFLLYSVPYFTIFLIFSTSLYFQPLFLLQIVFSFLYFFKWWPCSTLYSSLYTNRGKKS